MPSSPPPAEISVELSPVYASRGWFRTMELHAQLFRVWTMTDIGDPSQKGKASFIYLLGPLPSASLFSPREMGGALKRKDADALCLGEDPATGKRFYLGREEIEQILSEAQRACFDHEDCRANLELGMACRVQRAKKGR